MTQTWGRRLKTNEEVRSIQGSKQDTHAGGGDLRMTSWGHLQEAEHSGWGQILGTEDKKEEMKGGLRFRSHGGQRHSRCKDAGEGQYPGVVLVWIHLPCL